MVGLLDYIDQQEQSAPPLTIRKGAAPQNADGNNSDVWSRMIKQESGGKQFDSTGKTLTSKKDAAGIAQVMEGTGPEAAALAGLPWDRNRWLNDAQYNAAIGKAYFDAQKAKYGSEELAAAAYNGGPGRLDSALAKAKANGGSYLDYMPKETQDYVKIVTGAGPQGASAPAGVPPATVSPTSMDDFLAQRFPGINLPQTPSMAAVKNVPVGGERVNNAVGPAIGLPGAFAYGAGALPVLPGNTLADVNAGVYGGLFRAGQDVAKGKPLSDVLPNALQYYNGARDDSRQAIDDFSQNNPQATLANMAGEIAGSTVGSSAVMNGAKAMVPMLAKASPALGDAARTAVNFIGGTGGSGPVTKTLSNATSGAVQGAVATPWTGGDLPTNMMLGAGGNALVNPLIRMATAPLRATAGPEAAQLAQSLKSDNITLPGAAILDDGVMKKYIQSVAGKGDIDPVEALTRAVGKQIGADTVMDQMGVRGLTQPVFDKTVQNIRHGLESFAQQNGVNVDAPLLHAVDAVKKANVMTNIIDDGARKNLSNATDAIENHLTEALYNNGSLTGKQYQQLTDSNSVIAQLKKTPVLVPYAKELENALGDALERSDPAAATQIADLRNKYRMAMLLEPVVDKAKSNVTGLLDPKVLSNYAKSDNGQLGHLAKAGQFLPSPDAAGAVAGPSSHSKGSSAAAFGAGGIGGFLGGLGHNFDPSALFEHLGSPETLIPAALAATGLYGAKKSFGNYLASPAFSNQVIQNTLNPGSHYTVNPLVNLMATGQPNWFKSGAPNP